MNKNKLIQMMLAVTLPGVATFGTISITDNLGVRGFVQGSYETTEIGTTTDTETLDMNWADVDFLFSSEKVGAEVHLSSNGDAVNLEQAFLAYDLGGGLNVTGGKYLSLLGYEGDEPYKLYQRSMAYKWNSANNKIPFAAYHQGVKIAFSSGDLSGAISVVDDVYNSGGTNGGDSEDVGFEAQIKYTGLENFTIAIGTAQSGSGDVTAADTADRTLPDPAGSNNTTDDYYNFWVEYGGIDSLILGAEYNSYKVGATGGTDGDSWMLMGNYSVNEKLGVTLRLSEVEEGTTYEADKFTISPSYSFSDSLLGRVEYSTGEINGKDADYFSLEALFTF